MGKLKFSVSPEIKLDIVVEDVSGDLRISGWERDEIGGDGDRVTVRQADDGHVVVRCAGDCRLSVPARASIKIHNIAGDARITGIEGEAVLDNVAGDLIIRDVGPVRLPTCRRTCASSAWTATWTSTTWARTPPSAK
ncbi:MAG: hypothetical protein M5R40_09880 [Anaerolineae bacterium]|nr:hypothetical protein [Anaerolineae bacterium]